MKSLAALLSLAPLLLLSGCGPLGQVQQGRVIAYDRHTRQITLIPEKKVGGQASREFSRPVTIAAPQDPAEMGPEPTAGGLMRVDSKNRLLVIYDRGSQTLRTIPYTPTSERHDVVKNPGLAPVDRVNKTITIYSREQRAVITFAASVDLLALPAETWRSGDVVRYYYKDPRQALRLMNVTKTDLSKSSG